MGVAAGALAAGFILSLKKITPLAQRIPIILRLPLAGAGVGLCAALAPEVMGVGYDTVNAALMGEIALVSAVIILGFKFLATVIGLGLTLPGGLIGPTLVMGALLGCATGLLAGYFPVPQSEAGLYAILGMGAMMGAVLQAPLAALLAIVELTGNINIIFPGMLAIISATLACKEWFGQTSVYLSQIEGIGINYRNDPMAQSLRRLSLRSVLNSSFAMVQPVIRREQARKLFIESSPHWLILSLDDRHLLMPAADLGRYLEENDEEEIRLMEVPSRRQQLVAVRQQATLQQALDMLDESGAEAVYAIEPIGPAADRIYGVATRQERWLPAASLVLLLLNSSNVAVTGMKARPVRGVSAPLAASLARSRTHPGVEVVAPNHEPILPPPSAISNVLLAADVTEFGTPDSAHLADIS